MADMAALREGIAANLSAIDGLQASAYMLSNPAPRTAWVFPDEVDYDQAFHRALDYSYFTVQVFVAQNTDVGSQQLLDQMLAPSGSNSVKAALEADKTLGGAAQDLRVTNCSGYTTYPRADGSVFLGADWRVQVLSN